MSEFKRLWRISSILGDGSAFSCVVDSDDNLVATVRRDLAAKVCAAEELAEACESMLGLFELYDACSVRPDLAETIAINKARAALAKYRGEKT